jgi:hypothetical protein
VTLIRISYQGAKKMQFSFIDWIGQAARQSKHGGIMTRLTTTAGAPVADNQNTETAGPRGPVLLQDYQLLEKLAAGAPSAR